VATGVNTGGETPSDSAEAVCMLVVMEAIES
jgi:hypothetical protein